MTNPMLLIGKSNGSDHKKLRCEAKPEHQRGVNGRNRWMNPMLLIGKSNGSDHKNYFFLNLNRIKLGSVLVNLYLSESIFLEETTGLAST